MKPAKSTAKSNKPAVFKRDAPDLPTHLTATAETDQVFNGAARITLDETHIKDLQQTGLRLDAFNAEGSLLDRIQLSESQFGSIVWKDVRLTGCDLANIRAHRITLVRVELIDCRLTGFRSTAVDWQDVLIQNCDVRYAQLERGKFRNCEFDGCNLEETSFQDADLSGSVFRSCNLARADLQRARLKNADFRKSEVEGMLVGINDLNGAIVDPAQAMVFARLLGLKIL